MKKSPWVPFDKVQVSHGPFQWCDVGAGTQRGSRKLVTRALTQTMEGEGETVRR